MGKGEVKVRVWMFLWRELESKPCRLRLGPTIGVERTGADGGGGAKIPYAAVSAKCGE